MKIALALPPFSIHGSYGGGGRLRRGVLPPLGVGYLAATLEEHGHEVCFVDAPLLGLNVVDTAKALLAEKPALVGISCLTKLAAAAYALAAELKQQAPAVPVVLGGPHATSFPDTILEQCPDIDVVIPGEGEAALTEVVECLAQNTSLENVKGVIYRSASGSIVATPPRPFEQNLNRIPSPVRHIYRNDLYSPLPNQCRRSPATTVITSRGCSWGQCAFCYQGGKYSSPYRRRSPENVIEEIRHLVKDLGIREIIFWDDNFGVGPRWIDRFCDLLDKEKIDITWTIQARVNTVTEAMLQRMAASGCYNVYYGLESGCQEMLDLVCKGITLDQSRAAVRWAKKAGMEIRGSFIFGMPKETPEMALRTLRFACELNIDWMIFYPYHLQPGTKLAEIAALEGTVLEEDAEMLVPSYYPSGYQSPEELAEMVRKAYRRYYLRPRYIGRVLCRARHPVVLKNYFAAFWYWLQLSLA